MGKRLTDLVKIIIDRKKDIKVAADMTVGAGNDSLYILENTKVERLYGFDIQKEAEIKAKKLIGEDLRFIFNLASHDQIENYVKENLDLAIYNLGYLPGGNKEITTKYQTTIKSLEKTLDLLNKEGKIILTIYPGHPAGKVESEELEKFLAKIDPKKYAVMKLSYQNRPKNPPYIIVIQKN
ncbi:class I SAM-dependent methyltransferase [Anaerococcus murdochii]|uniref:tRNA (mnm(5)s(2)U34)-methyltransferase n=1 Tax=Anaerococcus murdochii TaxID=411577 RepID=UPI0032B348F4